jgi:photosystem II stability/assembly factor-like uncharacterized protein
MLAAADTVKFDYACSPEDVEAFGLTCSDQDPCPVFLELASVDTSGLRVFIAGNLHTVTTTLYGILLTSEDGGQTWAESNGRLHATSLDEIQFADSEHGWVSGVKLEPLPRDPFLLITADGGKSWRPKPLFDETRFGSIQQFWFESAKSGEAIVEGSKGAGNAYERYATSNGGDSWSLKAAGNKPLQLSKSRPKDSAAWRVRADAQSKTYRVERRVSERWEPVAMFPVQAGVCK